MKISRDSWHAKVYAWWYAKKYDTNVNAALYTTTPNLCPYVRAILFWAPLSFLLDPSRSHFAKFFWSVIATTLQAGLIHLWGKKGFLIELGVIAELAGILGVVIATFYIVAAVKKVSKNEVVKSFVDVLEARYQASHSKICPAIELVDG